MFLFFIYFFSVYGVLEVVVKSYKAWSRGDGWMDPPERSWAYFQRTAGHTYKEKGWSQFMFPQKQMFRQRIEAGS